MHLHKPKAAHSIREFAIEIGTITTGILIALGLEAGIEALHHRELADHARADLRQELKANSDALATALASQKTAMAGLDAVATYLQTRLSGKAAAAPKLALTIRSEDMGTAAWESTVATQALTYMPYDQAQALVKAYSATRAYNGLEDNARTSWFQLSTAFAQDPGDLDPAQLRGALHDLALSYSYTRSSIGAGQRLAATYRRAMATIG